MTLDSSRRLAYALAPFFLAVDVWRRFGRWHEWPMILDDVVAGVLFVVALVRLRGRAADGRLLLAGAYGYAVGMMYGSVVGQLVDVEGADVSGLPSGFVAIAKGVLLALCVVGFVGAVRRPATPPGRP